MTELTINGYVKQNISIPGVKNLAFTYIGAKTHASFSLTQIYGVFRSAPILVPNTENFISWENLVIDYSNASDINNIWVFFRSFDSDMDRVVWRGPFKDKEYDVSFLSGKYFQIMAVIGSETTINSIYLSFLSSRNSSFFYSTAFNIGFQPKHLVLTYNGDVSENSIVRFAVSGEDTTNLSEYQFVTPDKIQELSKIGIFSDKIKIMMEIAGDSGVSVTIHEIAAIFSGDGSSRANLEENLQPPPTSLGDYLVDENGTLLVSESDELIIF